MQHFGPHPIRKRLLDLLPEASIRARVILSDPCLVGGFAGVDEYGAR